MSAGLDPGIIPLLISKGLDVLMQKPDVPYPYNNKLPIAWLHFKNGLYPPVAALSNVKLLTELLLFEIVLLQPALVPLVTKNLPALPVCDGNGSTVGCTSILVHAYVVLSAV